MSQDPLDELDAADRAYREAQVAIEDVGENSLERLADAHDRITRLLDRYEDTASGSGREAFQSYLEFQGELSTFEDELPEDLPGRDALEAACEALDRRRLESGDFERAREELAPAVALVGRLEEREAARERYRSARRAVEARIDEVDATISDLEATLAFADVDLDANVEALRDPIVAYDDAVDEAFRTFRRDAPARTVLSVYESASRFPLVPARAPPEDLANYLRGTSVGEEPLSTVLEYADYSRSKLDHYVDDPGRFRVTVAGNRTYFERLDAAPFRIDWPPPAADVLRFRARELVSVVDRFAPDDVVAKLQEVRGLLRDPDYERLREVARAREALDEAERERLRSGEVRRDLDEREEERERLRAALDDHPVR